MIGYSFHKPSSINSISGATYKCNSSISCGCSVVSTDVTARIIGGEAAMDHAWGWMVSFQQSNKHRCGASLITAEYAVTTAHCVAGENDLSILSILAGTNYLDGTSNSTIQRKSIVKMTMHPNYNADLYTNDIAILQFSPLTISSNSNIAFICLPNEYQDPFQINTNLVALGWGVTVLFGNISNDLQQVTVQVVSSTSENCTSSEIADPSVQFCAGTDAGGKDACAGDSGGPLMAFDNNRWVLAGIVSTGYYCALKGFPGVYTRVSSFISFINSTIGGSLTQVIPATTSTSQTNYTRSTVTKNTGNTIDKSILILFLIFFYL